MMQEHGMVFKGFGHTTRDFFVGLRDNNSKAWFEEHRDRYEAGVREPAEAFIGELGPRLAEWYPACAGIPGATAQARSCASTGTYDFRRTSARTRKTWASSSGWETAQRLPTLTHSMPESRG